MPAHQGIIGNEVADVMANLDRSGAWTPLGQTPCGIHPSADVGMEAGLEHWLETVFRLRRR